MSIEEHNLDKAAALALVEESEVLKGDQQTKDMIEQGLDGQGRPITDIGNFIAGRERAVAEMQHVAGTTDEERDYTQVVSGD